MLLSFSLFYKDTIRRMGDLPRPDSKSSIGTVSLASVLPQTEAEGWSLPKMRWCWVRLSQEDISGAWLHRNLNSFFFFFASVSFHRERLLWAWQIRYLKLWPIALQKVCVYVLQSPFAYKACSKHRYQMNKWKYFRLPWDSKSQLGWSLCHISHLLWFLCQRLH